MKQDVDHVGSKAGEGSVWNVAELILISNEVLEVGKGLQVLPREVDQSIVVEDQACWVGCAKCSSVNSSTEQKHKSLYLA